MGPILCSVLSLLCASVAFSQLSSLAELETRVKALTSETTWSQEKSDRADVLNSDLVKLIDSDVLKSASDFQRASAIVQFTRGALPEARMRYELTFIAATLGDETAAKNLAAHWDQFLLATGRPQHLGTMKSFQGTQAEKYKPQITAACVATVFLDPIKSREKVSILAANVKIRQLVE